MGEILEVDDKTDIAEATLVTEFWSKQGANILTVPLVEVPRGDTGEQHHTKEDLYTLRRK